MNLDTLDQWLEQLVALFDKLYHLPAYALIFVFCIALGYGLRALPKVPNAVIPWVVVLIAPLANLCTAEFFEDQTPLRIWFAKQTVIGLIVGVAAWGFHNKILSRLEEKLGLFGKAPELTDKTITETQP